MKHGDMRNRQAALPCRTSVAVATILLLALGGLPAHADHRGGGYYVSVEIPIEEHVYPDGASLRLDRLVDRRTGFDSDHFHLRELVLIARSTGAAQAELRVHGEASEAIDIPEGNEDEWWEVRIPAPTERHGGVWRLYLTGDVAVDQVVAVMEPRERYAARYQSPKKVASRNAARPYRSPRHYTYYPTYYPPSRYDGVTVHHVYDHHYRDYGYSYRTWYPRYASPWVRRYDPLVSFHYYTVLPGWRHDYGVHRHVLGGHRHHAYRQRPLRRQDLSRSQPPRLATRSGRPAPRSQATGRTPAPLDATLRTFSRGPDSRAPARRREANEPRVQPQRMAAARDRLESHAHRLTRPAPSRTTASATGQRTALSQRPAARQQRVIRQPAAPQTRPSRRAETWHGAPRNRTVTNSRTPRSAERMRTARQQPSMRREALPQRQAAPRRQSTPQRQTAPRPSRPQPQMRSFEPRPQVNRSAPRNRPAPTMSASRRSSPPANLASQGQGRLRAASQRLRESRR